MSIKKYKQIFIYLSILVVLSGCGMNQEPITSETDGIWNHFFVYPLSWLITSMADLFQGSYGLAIIMMTIVIRLILLPFFIKQQRSTFAMRKLQPEMKELREKYDTKDREQAQKLQQEMMQLYSKHGVNPVAGCLPIFIQMPILMAFYFAIMRTEEIANHNFLWMDLGQTDPLHIMPVAAGISMFIQTKVTMSQSPQQMKALMYIMPGMMITAGFALPSALSLYWFAGGIFMIFQSLLFARQRKRMEESTEQ
ncbi:YidC/Oxa1 family membrane protein insertase [Salibacterium salarium]|nr:YidC/Oxa1 family membrane protein insertase [Salibacterium salarium]